MHTAFIKGGVCIYRNVSHWLWIRKHWSRSFGKCLRIWNQDGILDEFLFADYIIWMSISEAGNVAIICFCSYCVLIARLRGITAAGVRNENPASRLNQWYNSSVFIWDITDRTRTMGSWLPTSYIFRHTAFFSSDSTQPFKSAFFFILFFFILCLVICLYWWLVAVFDVLNLLFPGPQAYSRSHIYLIYRFALFLTMAFRICML